MERIKGLKLEKLDFNLNKKGDFLYFEGPFLSHFYDDEGTDYLMLWVDNDSKYNRWLLFKTETLKLYKYLTKSYSLKKLLEVSNYEIVYFIDIDNDANFKKITLSIKDNIPKDYLPNIKSYFEIDYAEEYGLILKNELSKTFLQETNQEIISSISKLKTDDKEMCQNIFIDNNIRNTNHDILTLKSTELAIKIHYELYKNNDFQHLISIHSLAYTNPLKLDLYFTELNRVLGSIYQSKHNSSSNITIILEQLTENTLQIVRGNPNKFLPIFKLWKKDVLSNPNISENIINKFNDLEI